MSVDSLLAKIKRDGFYVSNFYEGTDGLWRVFLRDRRNGSYVKQATGQTALDALRQVMGTVENDLFGV